MTGAQIGEKREVPGALGQDLVRRRQQSVGSALGSPTLFVSRTKGTRLWDVDGNEYLDFTGGICCANAGHCDDGVVEAVQEQVAAFNHVFAPWHMYESYIELAEKLICVTPGDFDKRVLLFNSGAEAVENAVKAARRYTGRYNVLTFERAFHGRTWLAMGLTSGVRNYKYGFGLSDVGIYRAPYPYEYRCPYKLDGATCAEACLQKLWDMDKTHASLDSFAALIIEPVQGEGGYIPAPPEFLRGLRRICDQYGIVFIDDSVQTGLGRTGKLWAIEHSGVVPDILLSGKSLAGGLVLSAVIGRKEILDATDPGGLGGTFGGNPASCVAALKLLERIDNQGLAERAASLGQVTVQRLRNMQARYTPVGDVRGLGSMIGVEFVQGPGTKEPAEAAARQVLTSCRSRGLLLGLCGPDHNVIRFMYPLTISEEELKAGLDIFEQVLVELPHNPH
ncbi:MAG: aspartate aminotransferase family protein [Chloroflexota bacterium]